MNARDVIAEALWDGQPQEATGWKLAKRTTTDYAADAVLSALEAAGFTIARLEQVEPCHERYDDGCSTWLETRRGWVPEETPLYRLLVEGSTATRYVQAGWEYRDPAWPLWRWHLTVDEPVAWETRHPVYRIEGE